MVQRYGNFVGNAITLWHIDNALWNLFKVCLGLAQSGKNFASKTDIIVLKMNRDIMYSDGYLCRDEDLEQLPVGILEDMMICIYNDSYLDFMSKEALLYRYLEARKRKLDEAFPHTEENVRRLREMNELVERQSIEAIRAAYQIYQEELEAKAAHPEGYIDVEIMPQLKIPSGFYSYGQSVPFTEEKDVQVWRVLCSRYNSGDWVNVSKVVFHTSRSDESCEAAIRKWVYGCRGDEKTEGWGDVMRIDKEKVRDICFESLFYNAKDLCGLAMTDLLKIKKFDLVIEWTYEIL